MAQRAKSENCKMERKIWTRPVVSALDIKSTAGNLRANTNDSPSRPIEVSPS